MKLSLLITKNSDGWTIEYDRSGSGDGDGKALAPRKLGRIGDKGCGFPVPPDDESAGWNNKQHEPLCETPDSRVVERLLRKVFYTDPQANDIKNLGNYLSAVIFGPYWTEVCSLAEPNETIELELFIAPDDLEMQRLPWEMMYDEDVPLSALKDRDVSIARIIKSKENSKTVPLTLPLKVLFVIGRKLDNALRPGAEYLGLLRQMKIKIGEGEHNRHLNIKVLTEATLKELKESIKDFHPLVVHFIAHGDEKGRLLLSKRDEQTDALLEEPERCDAGKLLDAMRAENPPHDVPPIVVLNACHTSEVNSDANDGYCSLAARLVEGGISVAVGMTGEVADGACRLFTRRFYQTLISDNPIDISVSTARGRRAAMLFYVNEDEKFYENHIEWARPTLFLKENVTFLLHIDEAACLRAEAPGHFVVDSTTFCDRLYYLKHYQKFFDNSRSAQHGKMLLFSVSVPDGNKEQYGKTRLLRELAALTLLNGFIPCPIFSGKTFEPPPNLLLFALTLAEAMNFTRTKLKLDAVKKSFALELTAHVLGEPLSDIALGFQFDLQKEKLQKRARELGLPGQPDAPSPAIVRAAVLEDFKLLKTDLAKLGLIAPIVVFLDDLHRYDGVTGEFLNDVFFNEYGLGEIDLPVCVIATYSTNNEQSNAYRDIDNFIKHVNSRVYARRAIELKQIEEAEEARLAYAQHLLTLDNPLAANTQRDKQEGVDLLFKYLLKEIRGVPSLFNSSALKMFLEYGVESKLLLPANDETIYEYLNKKGN